MSGHGRITIGSEEKDVHADKVSDLDQHVYRIVKFPILITIPGNVPHQTFNPGSTDLIWFYFFPETKCCEKMRYFYPNGKVYEQFPSTKKQERRYSISNIRSTG